MLLDASDESPIHAVDHTFSTNLVNGWGTGCGFGRWRARWAQRPTAVALGSGLATAAANRHPQAMACASRVASCHVAQRYSTTL